MQGLKGLPTGLEKDVKAILEKAEMYGIFLVPNGELESWVPELMGPHNKDNKSLWATEAARKIEEHGKGNDDIWVYVEQLMRFILSHRDS